MTSALPPRSPFWLAHHRAEQYDRCLVLPLGRGLRVCSRCLALYPLLLGSTAAHLAGRWPWLGGWEWHLALWGVLPLATDWTLGQLGWRGGNAWRMASGALGGVSLGRTFASYLRDPRSEVFWVQLLLLAFVVVGVGLVRGTRSNLS